MSRQPLIKSETNSLVPSPASATDQSFTGWTWLENEVRNRDGGFCFGRSTDSGGNIEGLHDSGDSPAALLVDEAKSIGAMTCWTPCPGVPLASGYS
jgi:hypothetical protein